MIAETHTWMNNLSSSSMVTG